MRTRSSKETREFENKEQIEYREQAAQKRVENEKKGANRSKETREFENKEQTARNGLENLRTRRKLLKGNREFKNRE